LKLDVARDSFEEFQQAWAKAQKSDGIRELKGAPNCFFYVAKRVREKDA
jgi:hypothetical protein